MEEETFNLNTYFLKYKVLQFTVRYYPLPSGIYLMNLPLGQRICYNFDPDNDIADGKSNKGHEVMIMKRLLTELQNSRGFKETSIIMAYWKEC